MDNPFPPTSRYAAVPVLTRTGPDGETETYLARRLLSDPARFVPLTKVRLAGTERPDLLANEGYGDSYLWWRIADAAGDEDPATICSPEGRLLVIPLPVEVADGEG